MKYEPKPYQQKIRDHILATPRTAVHVDMGLGKTVATLTAMRELIKDNHIKGALVLAPLRVATITWPDEVKKWEHLAGLTVSVVCGPPSHRFAALRADADIYLCNYDVVVWLCQWVYDNRKNLPFDMVVLDESSKLKDGSTKRVKALKNILVSDKFKRVVELTGTPAPESYEDLWSQYYLLDKGERLEKYITHFRKLYCNENPYVPNMRTMKEGVDKIIQEKIKDITFTLLASDWLDLPPVTMNVVHYDMPKKLGELMGQMAKEGVVKINDTTIAAANAAVALAKGQQLGHGFIYNSVEGERDIINIDDTRLVALKDLIEQIGQHVMVAYHYAHDAERIKKYFPGCAMLGAGTTSKQAVETVRAWNEGKVPVLFIHPASVGHGMNLQAGGHHLIFYTAPWSCELYEQTIARLQRTGQANPVIVHYLSGGKFDDDVLTALSNKSTTQAHFKAAMRSHIPEKIYD